MTEPAGPQSPESKSPDTQSPTPKGLDSHGSDPQGPKGVVERRVFRGTGFYGSVVLGFLLGAAIIALIAQNTETVTVSWLAWDFSLSLAGMILIAVLVGALLAEAVGLVWRHRRRRMLSEREELRRLRVQAPGAR